jgi:Transposase DNA-binding/Transposase DDE domain
MVRAVKAVRRTVVPEFSGAQLGDQRRSERLLKIARRLERDSRSSFPHSMRTTGELEGFYRLMNSDGFTAPQLMAPHRKATMDRAEQAGIVLVVHDTTHVEFTGDAQREGLGVTTNGRQGFVGHFSLVLDSRCQSVPLGVSHMETYTRSGKKWPVAKKTRTRVRDDPKRESLRWWRAVETFELEREGRFEAIHVMDAEADFFELLSQMVCSNTRFIVRAGQLDRGVTVSGEATKLRDFANSLPSRLQRTVELSARRYIGKREPRSTKKRHPARDARLAKLNVAAGSLTLRKTRYAKDGDDVEINVLRIWEPKPPKGAAPVEWVLLTTEPINTRSEIERIVDWYRQRWVIEELFKALKTGCALEVRQLESYSALVKVTAILAPIAYRLLLLRGMERRHPDERPTCFFTPTELRVMLMDDSNRGAPPPKTLSDAMRLLARMGGHLKSNGPPGWLTLGRGYQHLLTLLSGWDMATDGFSR